MKKYSMLIITIVMVILTVFLYIYEHTDISIPEINKPTLYISSKSFGDVKNIVWIDNHISGDNALVILASNEKEGRMYSRLYYLNIDNGKSVLLSEFPSHSNLDDVILFENSFSGDGIITAYDRGIVITTLVKDKEGVSGGNTETIEIKGFDKALSMDFSGNLFYTRAKDKLIYSKRFFYRNYLSRIFNNNKTPDTISYYRDPLPYSIVNANVLDKILAYTSIHRDGIHLHVMNYDGTIITKFDTPVIKNVIQAKSIEDGYGFIGMNISDDSSSDKTLNIFMNRRHVNSNKYNYEVDGDDEDNYKLDTIPFNKDRFGSIPSIDSTTFNDDYTIAYTSYDENGRGQIKVCSYKEKPKVIVNHENIYGPIRISMKKIENVSKKVILYFTYEKDGTKVKICDVEGNLIKDITHMIID